MKMRAINHLTAAVIAIVNIMTFIAVLTGQHTLFGIVAASISLAVGLGMYLRVTIGTAALQVAEKSEEKLVCFAVAQQKSPEVVREFAKWVQNGDLYYRGARITDLIKARTDDDEFAGFWLLMVGSESTYDGIRKELGEGTTVLDYWPIDNEKWSRNLLDALEQDDELYEDGAIEELKG